MRGGGEDDVDGWRLNRGLIQRIEARAGNHHQIVDNRGGGNTLIGSEALVKAPPDGYTILLVTATHVINPSLFPTPYDAIKDFIDKKKDEFMKRSTETLPEEEPKG